MGTPHRVLLAHAGDWLGTARLPRLFARAGIATTALAVPGTLLAQSRWIDERIAAPPAIDAFVETLRRTIEDRGDAFSFVILADDELVEHVARHAGEAWLDRCFPVEHRDGGAALLTSKFAFIEAAKRHGLPLPTSTLATGRAAAVAAAHAIGFPVMIKRATGSGGAGVRRADDADDVVRACDAFGDATVNVEEFVDGIVGGSEVLYDRGRLVCAASFEKAQRYPVTFGPSAIRRVFQPPGTDAMLAGAGAATGFHGFVAICWQYDPQRERIALLEMNPRPGSGMHLGPEPAAMFAAAFAAMLDGETSRVRTRRLPDGARYHMFPQDVRRVIERRDLAGALAWLPGRASARDVPWDDPSLLRAQARELAHDYVLPLTRAVGRARQVLRANG